MSRRRACLAFTCMCFTILSTPHVDAQEVDAAGARADSGAVVTLDPLLVEGRIEDLSGEAISASEGRTGRVDLSHRPLLREGELMETVPGMILTQHSGDGKSNQMFVRGFNLDHGTDFRSIVEGMPVNLPTHAHGQGYTDLNFLVPELVERIDYRPPVRREFDEYWRNALYRTLMMSQRWDAREMWFTYENIIKRTGFKPERAERDRAQEQS